MKGIYFWFEWRLFPESLLISLYQQLTTESRPALRRLASPSTLCAVTLLAFLLVINFISYLPLSPSHLFLLPLSHPSVSFFPPGHYVYPFFPLSPLLPTSHLCSSLPLLPFRWIRWMLVTRPSSGSWTKPKRRTRDSINKSASFNATWMTSANRCGNFVRRVSVRFHRNIFLIFIVTNVST